MWNGLSTVNSTLPKTCWTDFTRSVPISHYLGGKRSHRTRRTITHQELLFDNVCRVANMLKAGAWKGGDRVCILHAHGTRNSLCDFSMCPHWCSALPLCLPDFFIGGVYWSYYWFIMFGCVDIGWPVTGVTKIDLKSNCWRSPCELSVRQKPLYSNELVHPLTWNPVVILVAWRNWKLLSCLHSWKKWIYRRFVVYTIYIGFNRQT